jgi:hypothetical protein
MWLTVIAIGLAAIAYVAARRDAPRKRRTPSDTDRVCGRNC